MYVYLFMYTYINIGTFHQGVFYSSFVVQNMKCSLGIWWVYPPLNDISSTNYWKTKKNTI